MAFYKVACAVLPPVLCPESGRRHGFNQLFTVQRPDVSNTLAAASMADSLPSSLPFTRVIVDGCSGLCSDFAAEVGSVVAFDLRLLEVGAGSAASASAFVLPFLAPDFATVAFCSGWAAGWSARVGVASVPRSSRPPLYLQQLRSCVAGVLASSY